MKSHPTRSFLMILCMAFLVAGCAALEPTYNKTYDQLEIGMSEQRVLTLMGPPMARTTQARGADQWVYRAELYPTVYVYMQDGEVQDYQVME